MLVKGALEGYLTLLSWTCGLLPPHEVKATVDYLLSYAIYAHESFIHASSDRHFHQV